jgi:hypothetical protein
LGVVSGARNPPRYDCGTQRGPFRAAIIFELMG